MANHTLFAEHANVPPLPEYILTPRPSLLPSISDKFLLTIGPIIAYWVISMFFHVIDVMDYFPQYRLHTPVEVLKRNRVSRRDVFRDVLIQQILQVIVGTILNLTEPEDMLGKEEYDVAVWARRIRLAQRAIPSLASLVGIDAIRLGQKLGAGHPMLSGVLLGGWYPVFDNMATLSGGIRATTSAFAPWEIVAAKIIYSFIVPSIQFVVAIIFLDTWQYFLHRAMHMNKWLYTTLHSRHHRLYVPYAYGALYQHPFEGFLLDELGAALAYKVAGMTTMQGLCFFIFSTMKTVDDHCGYAFPWDPLQHLTGNNAGYHDVHHQSWGIKTNFSQPFFTFWDRILGTQWTGGDVSARYEKSRLAAQKAADADLNNNITGSDSKDSKTQPPQPYTNDLKNAKDLKGIPIKNRQPAAPPGKAELQAAGSRQQVLDDKDAGGVNVLAQESREEREAQQQASHNNHRRNSSSTTAAVARQRATSSSTTRESLKGLSQKVTGSTCFGGMGS